MAQSKLKALSKRLPSTGASKISLVLMVGLCVVTGDRSFAQNLTLPELHSPSVTDEWAIRGFVEFHQPELGETRKIIQESRAQFRLFPGVEYKAPEVPG